MPTRTVRRTRAVVVAMLAALAVSAAVASASTPAPTAVQSPAAAAPPGSAAARLAACRRSPLIEQRVAVVSAWMKPLPAARRLALRIELQQRAPSGRWAARTDVPGLGAWTSPSDAALGTRAGDVFRYRQAVGRLVVPSAYRFRVGFRWTGDSGAVVAQSSIVTRACRQPDVRPDLVLRPLRTELRPDGRIAYSVVVANEGMSPAPRASVAATFAGDAAPGAHVRAVGRLAPGATAVVTFAGPACDAADVPAVFAADAANVVDEADELDNELAAACPTP